MGKNEPEIIKHMQLSKKVLKQIKQQGLAPAASLFALPEKVLQFGTGVLLRGLPDHFIDKANKQNVFNGRIVVIKSTATGGTDAFKDQDGLFTLLERGVENGERLERTVINASISRVLSASEEWDKILQCAADPEIRLIISNTTEVGITYLESDVQAKKPQSFPGRVLSILMTRYEMFEGSAESGMVIIPTELIVDNGTKLKEMVIKLAEKKGVSETFLYWLKTANDFCNSLVDCIVPGKLPDTEQKKTEEALGYEDKLMIMSEPYRLWAIETSSERTHQILSFSKCDEAVVIAPDINKFRELKLRLLNATHTLSCGLAHLSGFTTVKEAMRNEAFTHFVSSLMMDEISPLIVQDTISLAEAHQFAAQVIDRFKNPFIEHLWLNITAQFTSKMAMRTVPLVEKHYSVSTEVPKRIAMGFAAFIAFMQSIKKDEMQYYGNNHGEEYRINDDKAPILYQYWLIGDAQSRVDAILKDKSLFGTDLTQYPGFAEAVSNQLILLRNHGAENMLRSIFAKKSVA